MDNQNITYPELRDLFVEHNKTKLAKPVSACIVCEHLIWYAQPLLEQGRPRKSWPNTWAGPRRTSAGG